MRNRCAVVVAGLCGLSLSTAALGVINPFTETFDSALANWSAAVSFAALNYPAGGGPDGSAYGSRTFSFANSPVGDQPLLFRGQSNFNSSGNAFVGDWVGAGVTAFTFSVRHDAPVPVNYFARWSPAFGPGIVFVLSQPVPPNTWTTFTIPVAASTPFIYETFPVPTFEAAFSNIARVQVGVLVGESLAGQTPTFTFDIDNVGIVPAPGSAVLMGLAALGVGRRRR